MVEFPQRDNLAPFTHGYMAGEFAAKRCGFVGYFLWPMGSAAMTVGTVSVSPTLYDPSRPEDLPLALRTAYGIIGVLLARHGSLELSDQTLAAIERGQGPVWESHPWGCGGLT